MGKDSGSVKAENERGASGKIEEKPKNNYRNINKSFFEKLQKSESQGTDSLAW